MVIGCGSVMPHAVSEYDAMPVLFMNAQHLIPKAEYSTMCWLKFQ